MTVEESGVKLTGGVAITADIPEWSGSVAVFFDYISEESNTAEASITDNYVESNYSLQDHIAIKPRIYRLRGYVGEVIFKQPTKWTKSISDWADKNPVLQKTKEIVKPINALSGIVSNYTRLAKNVVDQVESSYNRYKQIYDAYKNKNQDFVGIRQKTVSKLLLNLLETRTPVKLTELAFNDDIEGREDRLYFLQSVSSRQGDNAFISDYEVTIKEFRIARSRITKVDNKKFAGDVATQKTEIANNGKANTVMIRNVAGKLKRVVEDPQAQMTRILGNDVKQEIISGNKIYTIQDTGYSSQIVNIRNK